MCILTPVFTPYIPAALFTWLFACKVYCALWVCVCVGCHKVWCILLHGVVCVFSHLFSHPVSHPTHLRRSLLTWLFACRVCCATRVCVCRVSESHYKKKKCILRHVTVCIYIHIYTYIYILYIHPALLRLAACLAYMALCMQSLLRDAGVCVSSFL